MYRNTLRYNLKGNQYLEGMNYKFEKNRAVRENARQ